MRGLRGRTKGAKSARAQASGRCRFVVDEQYPFPASSKGRDEAEAKAMEVARRKGGSVRIDLACLRPWEGGEPLKLRALVAKCTPTDCKEPGEGMSGLRGEGKCSRAARKAAQRWRRRKFTGAACTERAWDRVSGDCRMNMQAYEVARVTCGGGLAGRKKRRRGRR